MDDPRFTLPRPNLKLLYRGIVSAPFTPLRRRPFRAQSLDTELLFGQGFDVYAQQGNWLLGRVMPLVAGGPARPHYAGYVPRRSIAAKEIAEPSHRVIAISAPVFTRADIKSPLKCALPMNAKISALVSKGGYLRIANCAGGSLGYIHKRHAEEVGSFEARDFVDVAGDFLGRPYIWGGTGGIGVDCSGLVQMSLAACGVDCPRDADQQEAHLGISAELSDVRRGDLIFWPGHVGIMETQTSLLHANAHHMATAREPLKKAVQRIGPPRSVKRLA